MNNALTGLGLALVLALVAALIGPLFVDWSAYRTEFAARASALVGAPVTVSGAVDARLLPSPYVRFHDVVAGEGAARLSAREIEITLAIGPLLRGDVTAERVKIVEPRLTLAVAADGSVTAPFGADGAGGSEADRIAFDRAEIVDGAIEAASPTGRIAVTKLSGVAEAGSLRGPFKFEGRGDTPLGATTIRVATARADASGALRVKLGIAVDRRPETFEADGQLTVARTPRFEGQAVLARPSPKASSGEAPEDAARENPPWRITAKVAGGPARLAFDDIDVSHGPDERALRLTGKGALALGARPRFELALGARQIDLDRLVGKPGATPAALLEAFATPYGTAAHPPIDGALSLELGSLVLAGDVARGLKADLVAENGGWRIERAAAQLPAATTLSGRGALVFVEGAPGFSGAIDFATADLPGFRDWLNGGSPAPGTAVRRFAIKGAVTARIGAFTLEGAELTADGAASSGRLVWAAAEGDRRQRIDADLKSESLDLDALGVDRLIAGVLDGGSQTDVSVMLDARALTLLGVAFAGVEVDAASDAEGLDVRRLAIGDAGGAKIAGSGRIAYGPDGPDGSVAFDVGVRRLGGLLSLARSAGAPETVVRLIEARAAAIAPAALAVDVVASPGRRTLTATGALAGGPFELGITAPIFALDAETDVAVELRSPDGARLATLLGLPLSPVSGVDGGVVTMKLKGAPGRAMSGEGRVAAFGLDLSATGEVAVAPEVGLSAAGDVSLTSPDLSGVGEALGRLVPGAAPALPVDLTARVSLGGGQATIENLSGRAGGARVTGRLTASEDPRAGFGGELAFDELSVGAVLGLALSPEALSVAAPGKRSAWPSAVFGPSPLDGTTGRVTMSAERLRLFGEEPATNARFTVAARRGAVAFEDVAATFAGGRLRGAFNVARPGPDATVTVRATLEGARAERLTALRAASPISGQLDLALDAQGTGRTLAAVVGALAGTGSATLGDGIVRRFDIGVLDRVEPQVTAGLPLEAPRIAGAIEGGLASADFRVARVSAPFTLSGGVARSGPIDDGGGAARIAGAIAVDLTRLTLDADLLVGPRGGDAPQLGVSFEGPLAAPKRRIDATALTGWLSVRAVERETRRIEAMEADMQERARVARARAAEAERVREETRKAEEARRAADEERRRREAEERARALPAPVAPAGVLPPALDITPPGAGEAAGEPPGMPLQITPQRGQGDPPRGAFDQP